MHYYRVIKGPIPFTYTTRQVEYFTVLPEGDGIEEPNAPVIGCELDLSDHKRIAFLTLMQGIYIHFDDKIYDYRTQYQHKDDEGNLQRMIVEVENGC